MSAAEQNIHINSLTPLVGSGPTLRGGGARPEFAYGLSRDLHNARLSNERFVSYTSDNGKDIYTYSTLLDEDNTKTRYPELNNNGMTKGQKRFYQKVLDLEQRYKDE